MSEDSMGSAPEVTSMPGDIEGGAPEVMEEGLNEPLPDEIEEQEDDSPIEEEIKELKKKLKLKVDGEEFEEEISWDDEDRIKRALQKEKAFDKRSQEWASYQKQVNQFVEALKANPADVLSQLGYDVDDFAYSHLQKQVEQAKKSPEQLAQEKLEMELKELKEEKERLAREKEETELEKLKNEHATQIEADIQSSLDKATTILPKNNPWVLRKVAETMILAMQNGYPEVTASQVIPIVEQQFKNDLQNMFDVFPEDVIEQVVKKQNLDRVRNRRLKSRKDIKTQTANQLIKDTSSKNNTSNRNEKEKVSYKDFFDKRF